MIIMRYIFNLLFLITLSINCYAFKTITSALEYIAKYPITPLSDNNNQINPDFSSFYKSTIPTVWQKLLSNLGFKKTIIWQPKDFLSLLKKTLKTWPQEKTQLSHFISLSPESTIQVWGELHAHLHDIVCTLKDMKDKHIINDYFKLIKENYYIVFMGDTINYSAYSLETLTIILQLLYNNPEKVFYLRGSEETKQGWYGKSLERQLKISAKNLSPLEERIPLSTLINKFFNKLPTALFFALHNQQDLLVISYFGAQEYSYKKLLCDTQKLPKNIKEYCTEHKPKLPIKVIIKNKKEINSTYGLTQLQDNEQNTTIWTINSQAYATLTIKQNLKQSIINVNYKDNAQFSLGPTYQLYSGSLIDWGKSSKKTHVDTPYANKNMNTDDLVKRIHYLHEKIQAFIIEFNLMKKYITKFPQAVSSLKELKNQINQAVESQKPENIITALNKAEHEFNALVEHTRVVTKSLQERGLLNIEQLDHAIFINRKEQAKKRQYQLMQQKKTIVLGTSMDLSKRIKDIGLPMRTGLSLKINQQNQEGGIKDKRVQIIFLDDKYMPALAHKNIETLINQYNTRLILFPGGTPTLQTSLDLIKEKKILVLFPESGSLIFRNPDLKYIVNYRASLSDEGKEVTDYMIKNSGAKKFVIFYQNDEFGIGAAKGAEESLRINKIKKVVKIPYSLYATTFKAIAQKIKSAEPDAIGLFSTGPIALQLIRDLGVEFLATKKLFAISTTGEDTTRNILKEKGLSIVTSQVVPNPATNQLDIVKEYRKQLELTGNKTNVFSLEGYIVASITLDILSKVKNPFNREEIITYIETIKNYTFKGLKLNFNPQNRSLCHSLWIDTGEGEWIERHLESTHTKELQ